MPTDAPAEYARWRRILDSAQLPAAVVDLDQLDHNLAVMIAALDRSNATIRLATKSLRCTGLLRYVMQRGAPRVRGLLTFSAQETAMLAELGFDDLMLAYPVARAADAAHLTAAAQAGATVIACVDDPHHVQILADAAALADVTLGVVIDLDVAWQPAGEFHFGVRRSPLRDGEMARDIADLVATHPRLRLSGVMAYEAQVAGVPDRTPGSRLLDPVRKVVKRRSVELAAIRRMATIELLRDAGHSVEIVNGGGTGSLRSTGDDDSVTEVGAGSGLLCPTLFDHYDDLDLRPAAFFALGVTRSSDPDHVTCGFGGYAASGPSGADRAPTPVQPPGLETLPYEGFGEVQTPFRVNGFRPSLGDPVVCRPAKAGEFLERFNELLFIRADEIVDRMPTYRGLGGSFG